MKALYIHAPHDLRVAEFEVRELAKGEVEVEIAAGGICGSDLHYYHKGGFGTVKLKEPMVLGHEVSGHVRSVGPGVEGLRVGQLVAVSPSRPCNSCSYCLQGLQNHCLDMRFYGSAMRYPHVQGAFREILVARAEQCVSADGLSPGEAAMAEPLAVALHAVRQAGNLVGKSVLVTGCGPIGALTILAARRAGAELVVATDLSAFALDAARSVGADVTINIAEHPDAIEDYAHDKGMIDVLFECSGAEAALSLGVKVLRPCGTVVQLGLGGDMTLPMMAVTSKELRLVGSFRFHHEFASGVKLMQKDLIDVSSLITGTLPLSDAQTAFEMASDRTRSIKTQISFSA